RIEIDNPSRIYDVGAGAGNVTRLLKLRWPNARIVGVDRSEEMLTKARQVLPEVTWELADLATWRPAAPAEIIYSNAALHWLPDHQRLFPALFSALPNRGVLAVQMPNNFSSPSHLAITEAVQSGPWRRKLEPLLRSSPVGDPAFYFDLLAPRATRLD